MAAQHHSTMFEDNWLLDPLLGGLTGVSSSPFRGVLMIVLRPSCALAELLSSFEQAGSGHLAQSWIGDGPNQPVSPKQLRTVSARIRCRPSRQTIPPVGHGGPIFPKSQLSQHLPRLVGSIRRMAECPMNGIGLSAQKLGALPMKFKTISPLRNGSIHYNYLHSFTLGHISGLHNSYKLFHQASWSGRPRESKCANFIVSSKSRSRG